MLGESQNAWGLLPESIFKFGVCWKLLLFLISEPNFFLGKLHKPEKKEEKMERKKKKGQREREGRGERVKRGSLIFGRVNVESSPGSLSHLNFDQSIICSLGFLFI